MSEQAIRERLKIYAIGADLAVEYMKELVNILEEHPHLGPSWGEKAWAIIHDMEDALDDLANT